MADYENSSPADRAAILYPNDLPKDAPAAVPARSTASQPAAPGPATQAASEEPPREDILYPDDKPGEVGEVPVHGAPSAYNVQVPEGMVMSREILDEVTPVFRELNLSEAGANKLMPLASKFHDRIMDGLSSNHAKLKAYWARQSKSDREMGGANWPETETLIASALDAGGAPRGSAFRNLLNQIAGQIANPKAIDPIADGTIWAIARPAYEAAGEMLDTPESKGGASQPKERRADAQRKGAALGYLRDMTTRWMAANPGKRPDSKMIRGWVGWSLLRSNGTRAFELSDEQSYMAILARQRAQIIAELYKGRNPDAQTMMQDVVRVHRNIIAAREGSAIDKS